MVVQMPCPDKDHVFAASSVENAHTALQEVQAWAAGNGYRLTQPCHPYTVYHEDHSIREWVLLERAAAQTKDAG